MKKLDAKALQSVKGGNGHKDYGRKDYGHDKGGYGHKKSGKHC